MGELVARGFVPTFRMLYAPLIERSFLGGLHAKPEFRRRAHRARAGSFKGFWLQAALCTGDQRRRESFFTRRINQK